MFKFKTPLVAGWKMLHFSLLQEIGTRIRCIVYATLRYLEKIDLYMMIEFQIPQVLCFLIFFFKKAPFIQKINLVLYAFF